MKRGDHVRCFSWEKLNICKYIYLKLEWNDRITRRFEFNLGQRWKRLRTLDTQSSETCINYSKLTLYARHLWHYPDSQTSSKKASSLQLYSVVISKKKKRRRIESRINVISIPRFVFNVRIKSRTNSICNFNIIDTVCVCIDSITWIEWSIL